MNDTIERPTERPHQKLLFRFCRGTARLLLRLFYRARAFHPERVPPTGALLLAANHQSYLDPPIAAVFVTQRATHFVARSGLFAFKPFGWLISALNSVPIRESAGDAGAIKELLRRLDHGEAIVIFPEGSRSLDGAMHEFKRGVALLVKRSTCPVVPVAIEGAFDAWPRNGHPRLPGPRIAVMYGQPIPHDELLKDGADAALRRLEREIDSMRMTLRARIRSETNGKYPRPGPGDQPYTSAPEA